MASCTECVHVEVCKDYIKTVLDDFDDSQMCGDDCEFFQDRSRFVELPCKVYTTFLGRVVEAKICGYEASMKNSNYSWTIEPQHFGKYVFFTHEEAEQALAKQNQPDNTPR